MVSSHLEDQAPTRVVIADDHPVTRDGLAHLVAGQGFEVVESVGTASECVQAAARLQPDLVLLDVALPDRPPRSAHQPFDETDLSDPIATVGALLGEQPELTIVALSGNAPVNVVADLLDAGCRGFAHKLAPPNEVLEVVVDAVALSDEPAEHKVYDRRTGRALVEHLRHGARLQQQLQLTADELSALGLLREGRSNGEIADKMHVSRSTVARLLRSVYDKMEVSSRTEAVAKAVKLGLLR